MFAKVTVKHPSGATYTGSSRKAAEWWDRFEGRKPEETGSEEPTVKGTGTIFLGGDNRQFESGGRDPFSQTVPVVTAKIPFGFVRNEENHG